MLSAQRKEFDEKRKDESAYPRDFKRWCSLDYFRRPRGFRSRRFYVTLGTALVCLILSLVSAAPPFHGTHQTAAVSKAHAMHAHDCAKCHDQTFQPLFRLFGQAHSASTSDQACKQCHTHTTIHHAKQSHEPACAACHREHLGHEVLATHVVDRNCTECHRELAANVKSGTKPAYHAAINSFESDHPEFAPSARGKKDPSRIKFNHKAHLDLDLEALRLGSKMTCADCHQLDDERRYLKPIQYDQHCARCHALNVAPVGVAKELTPALIAFSKTPAPHREPAIVRGVLRDRFIEFAQQHSLVGKALPSLPRPLPWKPVTDEQWTWASDQTKKAEAVLFMNKQWQRTESMTWCSHCHISTASSPPGKGEHEVRDGLPRYEKTQIPLRWYTHSVFNHGSHRTMGCTDCHDQNAAGIKVADSKTAADILLPTRQTCLQCHNSGGGARTGCVECHRYHERRGH